MAEDQATTEGGTVGAVLTGDSGWFLLVVSLGWFLTLGSRYLVPALLPAIKADFGLQNAGAGVIVTVIWLTYGAMQFPAGMLADRIGERTLLVVSTALAAISLVGFVLAPSYPLFVLAGAGFGVATGLFGPARGTALTKRYDRFEGLAFGTVLSAGSIGTALLPFAATLLANRVGWQLAIAAVVPAFVLSTLGLFWKVPRTLSGTGRSASVVEGVRRSFVALRTRRVGVATAAIVLMLFALQGLTAFYTTYLTSVGSLSEATAGGLFALLFLSGAVFQFGAGRMADRFGYRRVLVAVSLVSVVPLALLPSVRGVVPYAVVTVLVGIRLALGPMTNAYIIGSLPDEMKGAMWGFIRTGFFVLGSFGSTAIGGLADRGLFNLAIYGLAGLTLLAGLLYYFLPREPI